MSSSKQLIINCGASHVTAALTEVEAEGLKLERFVTVPLDYDFTDDDAWLGALRSALYELSHEHGFSGNATVIIPGSQILTKTIRIPHVEESKRAQILAFEAQQNIPYPLHEVVWDSQVVGDDGVETEILFIACKSNTIEEICSSVTAAGFTPKKISAATILEHNVLRLAYADVEEDVLVVNIGARSTNLLFKSQEGFFVRNIQLGGNTLSQNIADSLGKSFPAAEDIKQKYFNEDLEYSADDSGAKLLQGSADAFIRRISQEITRSIVNYRRQRNAAAPQLILLSGRGSLLPGLVDQLTESQKVTVEHFDPLQLVSLGDQVTSDEESLRVEAGEIIGEATHSFISESVGVNLLPDEQKEAISFRAKKPFLLTAALCLAIAPWPTFFANKQLEASYKAQAQELQSRVIPLQSYQSSIAAAQEQALAISESIEKVKGLVNSKTNWIQFFAKLQESLTQAGDVWLDDLNVIREKAAKGSDAAPAFIIELKGQMLVRETAQGGEIDREILTRRIKGLQSSFETSEFIVTSRAPMINWESINKGLNLLPFTINLVVDSSKTL